MCLLQIKASLVIHIRIGTVLRGFGLVWSGLVWSGLIWSGLVWSVPTVRPHTIKSSRQDGPYQSGLTRRVNWPTQPENVWNLKFVLIILKSATDFSVSHDDDYEGSRLFCNVALYQTIRRHGSEYGTLNGYGRFDLKSHIQIWNLYKHLSCECVWVCTWVGDWQMMVKPGCSYYEAGKKWEGACASFINSPSYFAK